MNLLEKFLKKKKIYLDYAAATPALPVVRQVMDKYWSENFHNPSSIYAEGTSVRSEINECRGIFAKHLGAKRSEIVFTSGGTESVSLAILGAFEVAKESIARPHIIISAVEHPAVVEAAREVHRRGGRVSIAKVDKEGRVSPQNVLKLIGSSTFLVSIMYANHEIGTIEPVAKIGRLVRDLRKKKHTEYPYLHTDASQAANYLELSAEKLAVDLLTIDSSKIYGPKGAGLLLVRPPARIRPTTLGGGQESGMRSGTENAPLIAGFTKAFLEASRVRDVEALRIARLKQIFVQEVRKATYNTEVNSPEELALPNIVSISVPNILGELLVLALEREGVLASSGSACSSGSDSFGSEIIQAIGKPELAQNTVRFSLGRGTTESEVRMAAKILAGTIERLGKR